MNHRIAIFGAVFVLAGAAFLLFYQLGAAPIRLWDEAIYANNAVEMYLSGDLWVLKNDGIVNLYNTKPPLVIWLQCLSFQLFGLNEFAVRFPSALAAWITVAAVLHFSFTALRQPFIGIIAALTLLSAKGFVCDHVTRTGDLDSVLTMFITLYTLLYLRLLLASEEGRQRYYLAGTTALVFLAFFSKSTAGLIPVFGLFLCTLAAPTGRKILTDKVLYLLIAGAICLGACYYWFREIQAAGYVQKVFDSEYKRLVVNIMPWHTQPFFFYVQKWVVERGFFPFAFLLPLSLPVLFWKNQPLIRRFTRYALIWSGSYFLLISYPAVKLSWYGAPMLPVLSLLVGTGCWTIGAYFEELWPKRGKFVKWGLALLLSVGYVIWLAQSFKRVKDNIGPSEPRERTGHYLRILKKQAPQSTSFTLLEQVQAGKPEHLDAAKFYTKTFSIQDGYRIHIRQYVNDVQVGDTVVTCQQEKMDSLSRFFELRVIHAAESCRLIVLDTLK